MAGNAHAVATCSLVIVNLVFPGYDVFRLAPTDSAGTVTVTCNGASGDAVNYSVLLSTGAAGAFFPRRLTQGGNSLLYNVYLDAGYAVVWGDGNGGTKYVADAYTLGSTSSTRSYPLYGRIAARQNMPIGSYADSIIVTLNF